MGDSLLKLYKHLQEKSEYSKIKILHLESKIKENETEMLDLERSISFYKSKYSDLLRTTGEICWKQKKAQIVVDAIKEFIDNYFNSPQEEILPENQEDISYDLVELQTKRKSLETSVAENDKTIIQLYEEIMKTREEIEMYKANNM